MRPPVRAERRLKYRLRNARLRQSAVVEDLDYRHPRGLDKALMNRLITGQWIKKRLNLLITGPDRYAGKILDIAVRVGQQGLPRRLHRTVPSPLAVVR